MRQQEPAGVIKAKFATNPGLKEQVQENLNKVKGWKNMKHGFPYGMRMNPELLFPGSSYFWRCFMPVG